MQKPLKGIYAICPETKNFIDLKKKITQCIDAGIKLFQIRIKSIDILLENELVIKDIISSVHASDGLILINDFFHLVDRFNFDGVHIGQSDGDISLIRMIIKNKLIGLSCYNSHMLTKNVINADYVSVGAFNTSVTKKNISIIPKNFYKELINIQKPLCLIGGINDSNFSKANSLNFDMIAISNGIFGSQNINKVTKFFVKKFQEVN